ncbi:MAG: Crp/Fnr family transcriptional regulator [Burkholderiales bacterium]|nr:Crp/Fnr family transcriptional regulator [Burkholderiales bacterium]
MFSADPQVSTHPASPLAHGSEPSEDRAGGKGHGERSESSDSEERRRMAEMFEVLASTLPVQRRIVRAGDQVHSAGERFTNLYVLHAGVLKVINTSADGRENLVGLLFKGDWLGFDGIATGCYGCDAVATDTGEVWALPYEALLRASREHASLLGLLHAQMSRAITRDRDSRLSLCTLSADARLAEFLRQWADAMARRGSRPNAFDLHVTRAEIGKFLGLTLETVSRGFSRLERCGAIRFLEKGRRNIEIPDLGVLDSFIQESPRPAGATLQ